MITFVYGLIDWLFPAETFLKLGLPEWLPVCLLVVLAFVCSIPLKFYTVQTLKAVLTLPKAFLLMFASLFKLKGANNKFIHTEHGQTN